MNMLDKKLEAFHDLKMDELISTKKNPYTDREIKDMSIDRAHSILRLISFFEDFGKLNAGEMELERKIKDIHVII